MSGKFTLDLTRQIKQAKGNIDFVVQESTQTIFRAVIMKTAVGNPDIWKYRSDEHKESVLKSLKKRKYVGGRARMNWMCSKGVPDRTKTEETDKDGDKAIAAMQGVVLNTKAGGIVYLCNSLDYIRALEYGHSTQAPQGMVRISIKEYQNYLNNAIKEVKK